MLAGVVLDRAPFFERVELMTDRIHALTVVLKNDIRDEDIDPLVDAISMFHGVLSVHTHVADPSEAWIQGERIRYEYRKALLEVLK